MPEPTPVTCPSWCTRRHGQIDGEDDTVHISDDAAVASMRMRLCVTIDPSTGTEDGPYVLLDDHELTLDQANTVTDALTTLLAQARASSAARATATAFPRQR